MTASSDISRSLFGRRLAGGPRPRARARAGDRTACAIGLGLLLAALIPPALLAVLPGQVAQLGPGWIGQVIGALLVLLPAATGLAAARPGLRRLARRWRTRPDKEHELAIARVGIAGLLFVHAAAGGAGIALMVAAVAVIAAWGWLLALILRPDPSGLRLRIAMTADIALLSAFLAAGDGMAACWWPVYLIATFYAGYRIGLRALAASAGLSVAGFFAVAVSTKSWRGQPVLSAGLLAALLVLPACLAVLLRAVSTVRGQAETAGATGSRVLTRIGNVLRRADAPAPVSDAEHSAAAWAARAVLAEISAIVALCEIESGAIVPSIEAFDLHALVKQAIGRARPEAGRKGLDVSLRVDPTLPFQLRGAAREVAQIAEMLVQYGVDAAESGLVRLRVAAASEDGRRLLLRLSIEHQAGGSGFADPERAALRLLLATRLAELIGGSLAEEPGRLTALLPATLDRSPPESVLDLDGRPVLLATEDSRLAGELAEPLGVWRGDVRWIGGGDAALAYLDRLDCRGRPILLADGRSRLLAALSFVQRAAAIGVAPPYIFLVVEPAQAAALNSVLDDELDGVVPVPVEPAVLANALRVLPLDDDAAVFGVAPPVAPEPAPWAGDDRVTAISEHPRFAPEAAPVIDVRAIEALRALDGDDAFLAEVIDSFAGETRQLLERAERAARAGDAAAFVRLVEALRGCAANLGGVRLCEVAALLGPASGDDLRANGIASVERLAAEATRLHAALLDLLPAFQSRRQ